MQTDDGRSKKESEVETMTAALAKIYPINEKNEKGQFVNMGCQSLEIERTTDFPNDPDEGIVIFKQDFDYSDGHKTSREKKVKVKVASPKWIIHTTKTMIKMQNGIEGMMNYFSNGDGNLLKLFDVVFDYMN